MKNIKSIVIHRNRLSTAKYALIHSICPISKLSTGKCPLIHRTYPQKKGEHPAYPQEKMTRFEQAASLPGKVRPRIS